MLALGVLGACGGGPSPLRVSGAPSPTGAERTACERLASSLPRSLGGGFDHRTVTPSTLFVTAWGDPPAILSCGVPGVARTFTPSSTLDEVSGVGWFTEDLGRTVRYSTPTRRPQVVLTLPSDAQAFDVLATLAAPVLSATKPTAP